MSVTHVPLLDLRAQFASIESEVLAAIDRVVRSQQFILGAEVVDFENALADYCGVKHCIGVSSGSDALLIAMMALDIGPGDEVITSSYSFFATAGAIARLGAMPVFVDIDPVSYNLAVDQVADRITPRTKAILPVHLFGQCAEMEPLLEIARRFGVPVIEDAAQAIGAEYKSRRAGSMGAMGCFSFFPSKNLGAFGDAGAVTTNDDALDARLRSLRMHGSRTKYYHDHVGGNFRIDALQAAVLHVKLSSLDAWTRARQANAEYYTCQFSERGLTDGTVTPPAVVQTRHIFNQFVIRCADRDALQEHLKLNHIGSEIYYPVPLHLQECFRYLGYRPGDLPHSEAAARQTLALPIYPELSLAQKEKVVATIANFYQAGISQVRRAA